MARRSKQETAYHEAAHAVATAFHPLAGQTRAVMIGGDYLAEYNLGAHAVNEATGLHRRGQTLSPVVNGSVDHEQVHALVIVLLAGFAADWLLSGERRVPAERDPRAEAERLKHSDGSDDFSRCWGLLAAVNPFDSRDSIRLIPERERVGTATPEELFRKYGHRALKAHTAEILATFEERWRETAAFVAAKWVHVQGVADALIRKRELTGDEVAAIIDRIEARTRSYPPSMQDLLKNGGIHDGTQ